MIRLRMSIVVWVVVAAAVVIGGVTALLSVRGSLMLARQQELTYTDKALAALPRDDKSGINTSHLAAHLPPPTNRWYSGLALQAKPQPAFPLPLKFTPTDTSFTFDMTKVKVGDKLIQAVDNRPVTLTPARAHHYQVTRYDEASVDLTYFTEDGQRLATVTVVAGSPYVYVASHGDVSLSVTSQGASPVRRGSAIAFNSDRTIMGVAVFAGAKVVNSKESVVINAPSGSLVTLLASTNTEDWGQLMENAENRVTSTAVTFKRDSQEYATSVNYYTVNNKPTYYARLPHHGGGSNVAGLRYNTIYGQVTLEEGNRLDYRTKAILLKPRLDLDDVSTEHKNLLVETLRKETTRLAAYPADTYFGGKMLYRDAQLLTIAKQLGQNSIAGELQKRLRAELASWLAQDDSADRSFYYDSRAKGIVGNAPSFGSEMFNDHHFHYGYFIYAASVLAQYDKGFKQTHKDTVNVLVADIANGVSDTHLPANRVYDAYFGHSWASGFSPFADGNNQESSSEAVNAWIGTGLWAAQIGNKSMGERAGWLLSNEVATTGAYWMNYDSRSYPYNEGYGKSLVVLNWGGKRDYATFFSASPKAMLGIQLLPMSPTSELYLSQYGRIANQLKEAREGQPDGEQFDDYILMYEAVQKNGESLLERAKATPDSAIDGANSRTYMYAWLLAQK